MHVMHMRQGHCAPYSSVDKGSAKSLESCDRPEATLRRIVGLLSLIILAIASVFAQEKPRMEKDLLGEKEIPANAYYGVQTLRALENFQISGVNINHYPGFVEAWAIVK